MFDDQRRFSITLGQWMEALYDACLEAVDGDEDLAEVMTVTLVQERLLNLADEDTPHGEQAAVA